MNQSLLVTGDRKIPRRRTNNSTDLIKSRFAVTSTDRLTNSINSSQTTLDQQDMNIFVKTRISKCSAGFGKKLNYSFKFLKDADLTS